MPLSLAIPLACGFRELVEYSGHVKDCRPETCSIRSRRRGEEACAKEGEGCRFACQSAGRTPRRVLRRDRTVLGWEAENKSGRNPDQPSTWGGVKLFADESSLIAPSITEVKILP